MNVHSIPQLLSVCAALFLFAAHAVAEPPALHWEPLCEPGGGGRIVSLAIDPDDVRHIVAGGDMLGAAVSFDGGDSWTACQGLLCYEMCTPTFRPGRQGEIWFGSCSGPLRSIDGGRTWQERRNGMPPPLPVVTRPLSRPSFSIPRIPNAFSPSVAPRATGHSVTFSVVFGKAWTMAPPGVVWGR